LYSLCKRTDGSHLPLGSILPKPYDNFGGMTVDVIHNQNLLSFLTVITLIKLRQPKEGGQEIADGDSAVQLRSFP